MSYRGEAAKRRQQQWQQEQASAERKREQHRQRGQLDRYWADIDAALNKRWADQGGHGAEIWQAGRRLALDPKRLRAEYDAGRRLAGQFPKLAETDGLRDCELELLEYLSDVASWDGLKPPSGKHLDAQTSVGWIPEEPNLVDAVRFAIEFELAPTYCGYILDQHNAELERAAANRDNIPASATPTKPVKRRPDIDDKVVERWDRFCGNYGDVPSPAKLGVPDARKGSMWHFVAWAVEKYDDMDFVELVDGEVPKAEADKIGKRIKARKKRNRDDVGRAKRSDKS